MERKFTFFVEPELEIENADESEDGGSEGEGSEDCMVDGAEGEGRHLIVRLDKWLWAARFFKTRALARAAVEAGKVFYNGERSKPSREIEVGAVLQVRQGRFEKTVIVKGLSTRRRSTDEALQLFEETEESKSIREQQSADLGELDHRNHRHQNHHSHSHAHSHPYHQPAFAADAHPYDQKPAGFLRRPFGRADNFQHSQAGQHSQHSQNIRNESRSPYRNPRSQTQYPHHNQSHHNGYNPNHRNPNYSNPYSRQQNTNYSQPYYSNQGSNHGNSGNSSNPYNGNNVNNGNQPYYQSGQSGYPNSNYNSGYPSHHHQSHHQSHNPYHHQNGHSHAGHAGYNPRYQNHNPNHPHHNSNQYPSNRSRTQNRHSIPNDNMEPQTEID